MKRELTVTQLITALRAKAKAYNERADALERDLKFFALDDETVSTPAYILPNTLREVTVDELKTAVRERKGRAKNFAEWLGTSTDKILQLIANPANGITNRTKGWLEIVEPTGNEAIGN